MLLQGSIAFGRMSQGSQSGKVAIYFPSVGRLSHFSQKFERLSHGSICWVGNAMVFDALTCCALLSSVSNLNTARMSVQHSVSWNRYHNTLNPDTNTEDIPRKHLLFEREVAVDHSTLTECFKKLPPGCSNLDDQARLAGSKSVDFEVVLQAVKVYPENSTQITSSELGILWPCPIRKRCMQVYYIFKTTFFIMKYFLHFLLYFITFYIYWF